MSERMVNFILIIAGGIMAIYAQNTKDYSTILMIVGVLSLFFGIYRTSRNIPSKSETNELKKDESNMLGEDFDEDDL